jgi:hypothetical protein
VQATELPTQLEEQGAGPAKAKAVAAKFPAYYKEEEKDSRYSKHPQEEVEQMVLGILGAYETKASRSISVLCVQTGLSKGGGLKGGRTEIKQFQRADDFTRVSIEWHRALCVMPSVNINGACCKQVTLLCSLQKR